MPANIRGQALFKLSIKKEKRVVGRWRHPVACARAWRVHGSGYSSYASVMSRLPLMLFFWLSPRRVSRAPHSSHFTFSSSESSEKVNHRARSSQLPPGREAKETTSTAAAISLMRSHYILNHERATHTCVQPRVATSPQLSSLFE